MATTSLTRRILGLPRPAWTICIGMFINKFGNFLSVFLVLYLTDRGYSPFQAGIALGAVGVGSFMGNGVGGAVADAIGRRGTIVASMFGAAGFMLLVPYTTESIPLTFALCVVIGFFSQLYRPAGGAILVDTVEPADRIAAFALLRLAINLGMSVGPVVGGFLSTVSYTYLFVGNAIASAVFGLLALLALPETRPASTPKDTDEAPGSDRPGTKEGYRTILRDPAMVLYLLSMFAATYVYVQTTATLPLHVVDSGLGNEVYGILLGVNALIIVLVELPLVKYTEGRDPHRVIAVGLLALALGISLTGVSDTMGLLLITVIIWTFGEMLYTPVATAYPGMLAPDHLRGRYQGAEGIAITLAQSVAPALGGLLYSVGAELHWVLCGMVAVLGAVLIMAAGTRRTAPRRPTELDITEPL